MRGASVCGVRVCGACWLVVKIASVEELAVLTHQTRGAAEARTAPRAEPKRLKHIAAEWA
jgi:hypothetical protein